MSLTRKHFKELAAILARHATSHELVTEIADFCASQNPNFDRMAFLTAIGVQIVEPPTQSIFLVVGSFDYDAFATAHKTIEEAMVQWHVDMLSDIHDPAFGDDLAPAPGTQKWFDGLDAAYASNDWKGYEILELDLSTMTTTPVNARGADIDWNLVRSHVQHAPINE